MLEGYLGSSYPGKISPRKERFGGKKGPGEAEATLEYEGSCSPERRRKKRTSRERKRALETLLFRRKAIIP